MSSLSEAALLTALRGGRASLALLGDSTAVSTSPSTGWRGWGRPTPSRRVPASGWSWSATARRRAPPCGFSAGWWTTAGCRSPARRTRPRPGLGARRPGRATDADRATLLLPRRAGRRGRRHHRLHQPDLAPAGRGERPQQPPRARLGRNAPSESGLGGSVAARVPTMSGTTPAPAPALTRSVRRGYGLGSVATGSFATVPGLLLPPYLTDHLGVGPASPGSSSSLPRPGTSCSTPSSAGSATGRATRTGGGARPHPRGSRARRDLRPALPRSGDAPVGRGRLGRRRVPRVRDGLQLLPGALRRDARRITDDYDERTRLMTWRVAILALAILVSGGLSPAIRDAFGPERGYPAVGFFVAALIAAGAVGAWRGTRSAPVRHRRRGRRDRGRAAAGDQVGPTLPGPARRPSCSRPSPPAPCSPGWTTWPGGHRHAHLGEPALRLLRRPGPRGDAALAALRHGPGQEARLPARLPAARGWCARARLRPLGPRRVIYLGVAVVGVGSPAHRCSRSRCSPTSPAATVTPAPAPASTRGCGRPGRPSVSPSVPRCMPPCSLSVATSPRAVGPPRNRTRPSPRSPSASPSCPPRSSPSPCSRCGPTPWTASAPAPAPEGPARP